MGCWKGTCGVSRLPISYNEPIRIDRMRLAWLPQCGAGSQAEEMEVHAAVAHETLQIIAAKWAEEEAENDEEDE